MEFKNTLNEGKTIELFYHSFTLSEGKQIKIEMNEGPFEHFFIIVKDPKGILHAMFTFKTRQTEYYITDDFKTTSNGSKALPMIPGEWEFSVLKTYEFPGSYSFTVKEVDEAPEHNLLFNPYTQDKDEVRDTQTRYYKGDVHFHSNFTDGRISLHNIYKELEYKKLDYLAMTDHSTMTTHLPDNTYPVITGTEITWDDLGHYNIYGLEDLVDYTEYVKQADKKDDVMNIMFKDFRDKGYLVSMNHPFAYEMVLDHELDLSNFTHLEIMNAPYQFPLGSDNEMAIRFFDYLWNQGFKLYAVGGSDAHKNVYFEDYPIGLPTTKIYSEQLTVNNLFKGLENGHALVELYDSFEIVIKDENGKEVLPGSRYNGKITIQARNKSRRDMIWQVVKNGEIIESEVSHNITTEVTVNENEFVRVSAIHKDQTVFFANPIHDMNIEPEFTELQRHKLKFFKED